MPPASCRRPSGYTSLAPTRPASGCSANTRSSASSQPGDSSVSLLRNRTYSPRAISAPRLHVPMKPRFCSLRSKRTPVTPASAGATGSGDASSTTITSIMSCGVCACRLFRHVNVSSGLPYTGITIEATGFAARSNASGVIVSSCRAGAARAGRKRSSGRTLARTRSASAAGPSSRRIDSATDDICGSRMMPARHAWKRARATLARWPAVRSGWVIRHDRELSSSAMRSRATASVASRCAACSCICSVCTCSWPACTCISDICSCARWNRRCVAYSSPASCSRSPCARSCTAWKCSRSWSSCAETVATWCFSSERAAVWPHSTPASKSCGSDSGAASVSPARR